MFNNDIEFYKYIQDSLKVNCNVFYVFYNNGEFEYWYIKDTNKDIKKCEMEIIFDNYSKCNYSNYDYEFRPIEEIIYNDLINDIEYINIYSNNEFNLYKTIKEYEEE